MTQPIPLFAALRATATAAAPLPFASAIHQHLTVPADSPWTPKAAIVASSAEVDDGRAVAELAAAHAAAVEDGRAAGLSETAELRAQLTALVAQLEAGVQARAAQHAEAIADAAVCVIEAWTGAVDRQVLFAPIVAAWLARAEGAPATAKVHPADVAAMTAAIGDAAIAVEADATIARGDVKLRSAGLDASHVWRDRLKDLRESIATALEAEGADHE